MQHDTFTFYAWRLSWYSAKVRSYLQYKNIPFVEKKPSLYTFQRTIAKHCGDPVVPVVITPEGEWLQDSSLIIERLESRFTDAPIYPSSPIQGFFSALVEIWADEFWHATAEHYRFSFPKENFPVWRDELSTLLPGFPRVAQHALVNHFYKFMLDVTDKVGVVPEKFALIESWTENQLDVLEQHFGHMPFLLGERATIGDFSLMGPIFGHLAWDPRSHDVLIKPRKNLAAWLARMSQPQQQSGALLVGDSIPDSLLKMQESVIGELIPYLEACVEQIDNFKPVSASDARYERLGPMVGIPYGEDTLDRTVIPYTLWMFQRALDM
ncbi:MAG: glutathione S-transferase family protein, partial [Spongiibacteraceae bacterium]